MKYKAVAITFWCFFIIIIITSIGIFVFQNQIDFDLSGIESIYQYSLSFYYSIVGFIIAIIIFSVQHINQKIDSEEISALPFTNIHSILTLILIFIAIIYNNICIFLELNDNFNFFSLLLLILLIAIILVNLLLTIKLLDINFVLELFVKRKIKKLKKIKLKDRKSLQKDSLETILLVLNVANSALIRNKKNLLISAFNDIAIIIEEYTKLSGEAIFEDELLDNVNDRITFIMDDILLLRDEKYLEDLSNLLKSILGSIIRNKKSIGDRHIFVNKWVRTVELLFYKSYPKERTIVCHQCLDTLCDVSLYLLELKLITSANGIYYIFKNISEALISTNKYWSAILLQKVLSKYGKFINSLFYNYQLGNLDYLIIKMIFDDAANIINNAKKQFTDFDGNATIFAAFYGMETLNYELYKNNNFKIANENQNRSIFKLIKMLLDFHYKVLSNSSEFNDNRVNLTYVELQYILYSLKEMDKEFKKELEKILFEHIKIYVRIQTKLENRLNYHFKEYIVHYGAMLIYFFEKGKEVINYIDFLIDIFNKNKQKREIYRSIKMFACWLNLNLINDEKCDHIIDFLVKNYVKIKEVFVGLSYNYDYPELGQFWDGKFWYLPPNYLWGNEFQFNIDKRLNGDGENYEDFHNFIVQEVKKRHNKK